MSFEGYYQILCKNGHQQCVNVYDVDYCRSNEEWKCPICSEECAWWNLVDITNGSYEPEFDDKGEIIGEICIDGSVELEIDKEAVYCTCSCGNRHTKSPQTYKIPPEGTGHHEKLSIGMW